MFLRVIKNLAHPNSLRVIKYYRSAISNGWSFTCTGNIYLKKYYYSNQCYQQLLSSIYSINQCRAPICTSTIKWKSIPTVEYLEIKEIPKHTQKLLIDVRDPTELKQTGEIPASINIPLANVALELGPGMSAAEFEAKYGRKKPNAETVIIFTCLKGIRSLKAAESAVSLGYQNVKNYSGSWEDWASHEGLAK